MSEDKRLERAYVGEVEGQAGGALDEAACEAVAVRHGECGEVDTSVNVSELELSGKLAGKKIWHQVLILAIWPFLEQIMMFLVGMVDTRLSAGLGEAGLAAVSQASYVAWLMGNVQMAVGVGASALISRAIGGKHKRLANAAMGQAIFLAFIVGVVMTAVVGFGTPLFAEVLSMNGPSEADFNVYLRVTALTCLPCSLLFVINACFRSSGDTRTPFWVLVLVNIVNVIFSYWFVSGIHIDLPFTDMRIDIAGLGWGVAGVAWGTFIGWCVGAMVNILILVKGVSVLRLRLPRLKPHWVTMKRILRVSFPQLIESLGMWGVNFCIAIMVGKLGASIAEGDVIKGSHMVAIKLESISFMPGFAIAIASSVLAGQYLGLGDKERAKQSGNIAWMYAAGVMVVMGVCFMAVPDQLVSLFLGSGEGKADIDGVRALTPQILRICGPMQLFMATYMVCGQVMRGAGDTRTTMILNYSSLLLLRLPGAYLLGFEFGLGVLGIWYALCGEFVVRGGMFGWRYMQYRWVHKEV